MKRTTMFVSALVGSFLIAGLVEPFVERSGQSYDAASATHMLLIGALCFGWCKADADERGIAIPSGSAWIAGIVPPIGVPLYFFRSKSKGGAFIACFRAVLLVIVSYLLFIGGYAISHALRT